MLLQPYKRNFKRTRNVCLSHFPTGEGTQVMSTLGLRSSLFDDLP